MTQVSYRNWLSIKVKEEEEKGGALVISWTPAAKDRAMPIHLCQAHGLLSV